jgi:hypothetical protein
MMLTDRELLEAAAKAAGNGAQWYAGFGMGIDSGGAIPLIWNPLDEDGDALRLAVKLGMTLDNIRRGYMAEHIVAVSEGANMHDRHTAYEPIKPDPYAATRRAIVMAAAMANT